MAERKVRFNKDLEAYVTRKWDAEIEKQVKAFRADYDERVKCAEKEACALVDNVNKEIKLIMEKYNLNCVNYGSSRISSIAEFKSCYIGDSNAINKISKYRRELQNKRDEALEDLKVECALGADRATFEAMIAQVTFD